MITFTSLSSGASEEFFEGKLLGEGQFGRVFALVDKSNLETDFVCKKMDISCPDTGPRASTFTKRERLLYTLNEIRILERAGLLAGYSRTDDTFVIVMKRIEGISGEEFNNDRAWYLYCALRELHRKNIAHMDCHPPNYIVSNPEGNFPKAHAIDFYFSLDATYTNACLDTFQFFMFQNIRSFKLVLKFYVAEMLKHANEHRFVTCQQILLMGALILAGIYGIPALAITHMMVREFISSLIINQLGKEISSKGIPHLLAFLIMRKKSDLRLGINIAHLLHIIQGSLSLYLAYSQLSYHFLKSGSFVNHLFNINKGWHYIFANLTPEILLHTGLMCNPILQIIKSLTELSEEFIIPTTLLMKKSDLFWSHPVTYAKSKWQQHKNITKDEPPKGINKPLVNLV